MCGMVKWSIHNINTHIYTIPWRSTIYLDSFFTLKQSLKLKNRARVWFSAWVLGSYIHRALSWLLSPKETQINNLQLKGAKLNEKKVSLLASLVLCVSRAVPRIGNHQQMRLLSLIQTNRVSTSPYPSLSLSPRELNICFCPNTKD